MVLTYINPLNKNYLGEYTYEFLFSKTIEINFGDEDIMEILDFNNCAHFFSEIDSDNININYEDGGLFNEVK